MFEKSLSDLVKGIRSNKKNEGEYISRCVAEIKEELRSQKHKIKSQAVLKLIYVRQLPSPPQPPPPSSLPTFH